MFKIIRITLLLLVLASVASTLLIQRNIVKDWSGTLDIRIIPVLADQKSSTKSYVDSLKPSDFNTINQYLVTQARRFDLDLKYSLNISLDNAIDNIPPSVPAHHSSRFQTIIWALKLKWWAWRNKPKDHKLSQIRLYVLYQSPADSGPLPHSTGLQNGLIGLVNARAHASQHSLHQVIITHELLHIWGASDKYDLASGQPNTSNGYAEPNKVPLLPQRFAALMARAKPLNETDFEVVGHLKKTKINVYTAQEIGWLKIKTPTN